MRPFQPLDRPGMTRVCSRAGVSAPEPEQRKAKRPSRSARTLTFCVLRSIIRRERTTRPSYTLAFMQRRTFLAASSLATPLFADDTLRVGVIGAGGRGRYLIDQFKEVGAQVAAVCDVYEPNLKRGLAGANTGAASFTDYRRLLDDKSLQAVIIATPDHWHSRMAIDAVQAGKDVYLEKPLAHTIEEGFGLIEAVRRTRRILQVGTQRRSTELFQKA